MKAIRPLLVACAALLVSSSVAQAPRMRIHCINVGQGSATLLEFKCGAVLVDTGGGKASDVDRLKEYLEWFFRQRPDLDRTLASMVLTHVHKDHSRGLKAVAENFKVQRFISNGHTAGSGAFDLQALLRHIQQNPGTAVREIDDVRIGDHGSLDGYRDADVDPLSCASCDPDVRVLASSYRANPGWPNHAFDNQNNHSVVMKLTLGGSSILITGDAETESLDHMVHRYSGRNTLDSDVLVAGHHGSKNGITEPFLQAVTPKYALISCGVWNDGQNGGGNFNTWSYGHPNKGVLESLSAVISTSRAAIQVKAGLRARTFEDYWVRRAIYCTAWDSHVVLDAYASGRIFKRPSPL